MSSRRSRSGKIAGGEAASFEKLIEACRHGIEAAAELACYLDDARWNKVSMLFQKIHNGAHELRVKRSVKARGVL